MSVVWDRQRRFAPIGPDGQERLKTAHVVIVGLGALGSVLAERMARAGVGGLRLLDRDVVEPENLGTQALYTLQDAEGLLPKAVAAARHLREIHPEIAVEAVVVDLNAENAEELLRGVEIVLDGTDNFETRLLLNDVCVKHGIPWVYASVVEGYGQTMAIVPRKTACLRCLYPHVPKPGALPTCETVGLLATAPAVVAALAATQALRLLVGNEPPSELVHWDVWEMRGRAVPVTRRPDCATCAQGRFAFLEGEGQRAAVLCGRDAVQLRPPLEPRGGGGMRMDLAALAERLRASGDVRRGDHLLRFRPSREDAEIVLFPDGRAILKGVRTEAEARSLYARYIGL